MNDDEYDLLMAYHVAENLPECRVCRVVLEPEPSHEAWWQCPRCKRCFELVDAA